MSSRGMRSKGFLAKRPGLRVYLNIIKEDPCVYCGGAGGTVEHIVPQSHPAWRRRNPRDTGPHHWSNMAMSCRSCNSRKSGKGLLVFLIKEWLRHGQF